MISDLLDRGSFLTNCDDPNYDIYKIDQLQNQTISNPEVPVLISTGIPDFDSDHVLSIFEDKYSIAIELTRKFGLVIAGGSISRSLKDGSIGNGDIDMFIVGPCSETRMYRILEFIRENGIDEIDVSDITLTWTQRDYKIQIILKEYLNISHIIHGFDIGAACVACDGYSFYMTGLGKFAFEKGTNILSMLVRSSSYEARLLKYFNSGFSIAFPYLDINEVKPLMNMPHMGFRIESQDGNLLRGTAYTSETMKKKRFKKTYKLNSLEGILLNCPLVAPNKVNYGQFETIDITEKEWYGPYFAGS